MTEYKATRILVALQDAVRDGGVGPIPDVLEALNAGGVRRLWGLPLGGCLSRAALAAKYHHLSVTVSTDGQRFDLGIHSSDQDMHPDTERHSMRIEDHQPQEGDRYTISDDMTTIQPTLADVAQVWLQEEWEGIHPDISVGDTPEDYLPKEICVWRHPTPDEATEIAQDARDGLLLFWAEALRDAHGFEEDDAQDILEALPHRLYEDFIEALDAVAVSWLSDRYVPVARLQVTPSWWRPHWQAVFFPDVEEETP